MAAEEILRFALFKEVLKAPRRKKRKLNNGQVVDAASDEEDDEEEEEVEEEEVAGVTVSQRARAQEKAKRLESEARGADDEEDADMEGAEALAVEEDVTAISSERWVDVSDIAKFRLDLFRSRLDHVFTTALGAEGVLELSDLLPLVNEGLDSSDMFGSGEARRAAENMHERNEIMFSEGTVYKV